MLRWIVVIATIFSYNVINAQVSGEIQLLKDINHLSMDSIKDRKPGTENERLANKYIRENWGSGKRTSYYSWEYLIINSGDTVSSEMVGSFLYNKAKATILLVADLESSADISLLLNLQNELAQLKLDANVMVVTLTSLNNEHQGLDYLLTHMPKKAKDIRLVIHLNETGHMKKESPTLLVSATSGIFEELQLIIKQFEIVQMDDAQLLNGDTSYAISKGIQALTVSTEIDSPIDVHGMKQIQEFLVQWVISK